MRNKEIDRIICNRIKALRLKNALTMEQLAYQSGISKGGLSEIERCLKEPKIFTVLKICNSLGITIKEFFDFEEIDMFASKL